jgi:alanyl-tRNA synthetase
MDSNEIRERFLAFFEERGHHRVPSSSLVPNDPTLLLTNAGMNQFKPYFLGEQSPPFPRAITVQKCFRTTDIDEVGKTARHLTFFEMLGNFSFGDYYKSAASAWAWELVTVDYGIDPDLLWVTVYETDQEARDIWRDEVGVADSRIIDRGRKDNFWSMGVAGPCGPCSEIFVDLGDAFGPPSDVGPAGNEDRYLEIWNLVFMQNDCNAAIEPISELPRKNIDTGAGVERLAMFLQRAPSIYETDTLGGMVKRAEELVGKKYGSDGRADRGLRIMADHGRSLTFLIADGVLPSNEGRGYVLRRVMRRAVRQARLLGREEPTLVHLVDQTLDLMGKAYPELLARRDFIVDVATREEERFSATLRQGLALLDDEIATTRSGGASSLPGSVAFKLHDTFGFPIDITTEIAAEAGLDVESEEFERLMSAQRERARSARTQEGDRSVAEVAEPVLEEHGSTEFLGYEHLATPARVVAILKGGLSAIAASEGDVAEVVLDRTVFYAEGGGQVGDRGLIQSASGSAEVVDTHRLLPGLTGHRVRITAGEISVGDEVEGTVDPIWREGSQEAHTATHIVHWILRDRLGEHARQAGSLVEPGRLRFDFNHYEALSDDQLADISGELQHRVFADDGVRAYETSYEYALSIGAMAIFGEKYGDFVRVVEIGEYSKELCGGTHVPHTSRIGVSVITAEGSVGANLRRVEALVGRDGLDLLERRAETLERIASALKVQPDETYERLEKLLEIHKDMEHRIAEIERADAEREAKTLVESAVDVDGARLVVARRDLEVDALRALAQTLRSKLGSGVVILGRAGDGRANLIGAVTKDLVERGLSAKEIIAPGAAILGGGGGGKPDLAISGGPNADRIEAAIEAAARAARSAIAG